MAAAAAAFECAICTDEYAEPVTAPCGHNFCHGCLVTWITSERATRREPTCPVCRASVAVDPAHLQVNHVLARALAELRALRQAPAAVEARLARGAQVAVPSMARLQRAGHVGRALLAALTGFGVTPVTTLSLEHSDINDEALRLLAEALQQGAAPLLTTLALGENRIGAEGATALARALIAVPLLTALDLHSNTIGDAGAAALAGALTSVSQLTTLDLRFNHIYADGAVALARNLSSVPQLTTLYLRNNYIGDAGAALAGALSAVRPPLLG